jgi:hypothetical protein
VCEKTAAAAGGLLFRCRACPNAFCEDHLPDTHIIVGKCPRLEPLGFRHPPQACYIHCDDYCAEIASGWREPEVEAVPEPERSRPQIGGVEGGEGASTSAGKRSKRKRAFASTEQVILGSDYKLGWTNRGDNEVVLASASFSAMKDFMVRQLGGKYRLTSGQLLSKVAALSSGCQTGGDVFWEMYVLARRLLLRPQDRWRLRPDADMASDLRKAARREQNAAAREQERINEVEDQEKKRDHLDKQRQERRQYRRDATDGEGPWEDEPLGEEEKAEMTLEVRAHLKETAQGYLFLKGKHGATLIQMKAAKLFKRTLNKCKTLALGVDLPDVLEELMDEGKVECTNPPGTGTSRRSAHKRITALSSFLAPSSFWLADTPLAWLELAGRTDEEKEFFLSADQILTEKVGVVLLTYSDASDDSNVSDDTYSDGTYWDGTYLYGTYSVENGYLLT